MPRAPGPILRVSLLSRPTWFIASPALVLFALIPLAAMYGRAGRFALPWVIFGPIMGLFVAVLAREALTHVDVGRDGVLLRRRSARRFLPFSRIASIEDHGQELRFHLRAGGVLVVRTNKDRRLVGDRYVAGCDELVSRIREGIERTRVRDDEVIDVDGRMLLAHARSTLGCDTDDAPSYRTRALPPADELWRIVDDPDADETARAAAAVALRRRPEAKVRLRVRADETASPSLRKLLRVVADDEADDAVARSLEACARRAGA